jgi:acyl transferase domain-containing protein
MNFSVPVVRWARRFIRPPKDRSKLLFVFQGRQGLRVGMGQGLYASQPVFKRTVDACAAVIEDRLGVDLTAGFRSEDVSRRAQENEFHSILTHGLLQSDLRNCGNQKGSSRTPPSGSASAR